VVEDVEMQLGCVPTAPESARAFVREALQAWNVAEVDHVAELLTSELVTNAVRHAGSPITVRAFHQPSRLRVEVEDTSSAAPTLRRPPPEEPSGRGLLIVDRLADEWGTDVHPGGKTVWFEMHLPAAIPEVPPHSSPR
jgi:anti-sigma regulatory factor (Ser/Thr protein kinase)